MNNEPHMCVLPVMPVSHGQLWRCRVCLTIWRVSHECVWCEQYGRGNHTGYHALDYAWTRATRIQRIFFGVRNRRPMKLRPHGKHQQPKTERNGKRHGHSNRDRAH